MLSQPRSCAVSRTCSRNYFHTQKKRGSPNLNGARVKTSNAGGSFFLDRHADPLDGAPTRSRNEQWTCEAPVRHEFISNTIDESSPESPSAPHNPRSSDLMDSWEPRCGRLLGRSTGPLLKIQGPHCSKNLRFAQPYNVWFQDVITNSKRL